MTGLRLFRSPFCNLPSRMTRDKLKTRLIHQESDGLFPGTADGIRTHDLQSRSLALYPAELRPHILFAPTLQGQNLLV